MLPGLFRGGLVVARRRVVVEAVIGAFVDVSLMRHVGFAERLIESRPSPRDALVELAVLRVDRRLDLGDVLGLRLRAVERYRGVEVGAHPHRQLVDNPAAKAEADRAQFAGRVRARLQPFRRREEILAHLAAVELAEQRRSLLFVARIPTDRTQLVRREGDEIRDRQPPRDILDEGVEAAILVDDDDRRLFRVVGRPREVALDRAISLRRLQGLGRCLDPLVVRLDLDRPGVIRPEHLEQRHRGDAADREFLRAVEKLPPADAAMHIAVEKVQQFLWKVRCLLALWLAFHDRPPVRGAFIVLCGSAAHHQPVIAAMTNPSSRRRPGPTDPRLRCLEGRSRPSPRRQRKAR